MIGARDATYGAERSRPLRTHAGQARTNRHAIFRMIHQRLTSSQPEKACRHRHHGGGRCPPSRQVRPWATGDHVHGAARELAGGSPMTSAHLGLRCGGRGPAGRGSRHGVQARPSRGGSQGETSPVRRPRGGAPAVSRALCPRGRRVTEAQEPGPPHARMFWPSAQSRGPTPGVS
jgi:hypothetical protein